MELIPTMVDGLTELAADLFNQIPDETENTITSTGAALTNGDLSQLAKAIASYAVRGAFYIDSGSVNTYTLTLNAPMRGASSIEQGMCIRAVVTHTNTGASTVQPAGLASTTAVRMDGSPTQAGDLAVGDMVAWFYVGAVFKVFNFSQISANIGGLGALAFKNTIATGDIDNNAVDGSKIFDGLAGHFLGTQDGAGFFSPVYRSAAQVITTLGLLALAFKNTVASGDIDNKAVTIPKLADGVDGQLITWGTTGIATTVATGSAGQVLTSNGAGNPPSMQSGAASTDTVFSVAKTGVTVNPQTAFNNPANAILLAEMTHTFTPVSASNDIEVFFGGSFDNSGKGAHGGYCGIWIDGNLANGTIRGNDGAVSGFLNHALETHWKGNLSVASHTIEVRFYSGVQAIVNDGIQRNMLVKEITR